MFKNSPYITKSGTAQINALGLKFDIRYGANQYVLLKKDGILREIIQDFKDDTADSVPIYFIPIKSKATFSDMADGSGRNNALYNHIYTLMVNNFSVEDANLSIRIINEFIFDEPLDEKELNTILRPDSFKNFSNYQLENEVFPKEFTDICIAETFSKLYKDKLRFSSALGWLTWNGKNWEANDQNAELIYMEYAKKCLEIAKNDFGNDNRTKFAKGMNSRGKLESTLKTAKSLLQVKTNLLDSNPLELNTPGGIVDLRTGEIREHDPNALCTKITLVSPEKREGQLWNELLNTVTNKDKDYIEYLKVLAGTILIGKVYNESLIIAFGDGCNGKSTVFNTMFRILNDYSGKISAEALTTKNKNVKVDLAELFGKRFVLASETDEGSRLSNAMLKQIASTDEVTGEKKYRDPFTFVPTHTALLYTNFLPRISSIDTGTWRRLIVCPFHATILNPQKDFADRLLSQDGPAILQWMIEGAKEFISNNYQLPKCTAIETACDEYKKQNNWLEAFIEDRCDKGEFEKTNGGVLYKTYIAWCDENCESKKSNNSFADALHKEGFECKHTKFGNVWQGIGIRPDYSFQNAS